MTPVGSILGSPELLGSEGETIAVDVETQAALSTALVSVFRGKFCDLILHLSFPKISSAADSRREAESSHHSD
jgi:hypothetical protein